MQTPIQALKNPQRLMQTDITFTLLNPAALLVTRRQYFTHLT